MKAIIAGIVVAIVMMVAVQFKSTETITYIKESAMEVAPEPKEAWMLDEEAIQAAKDVIRKKELEAEITTLEVEQASTTARLKELRKELDGY
jgi:hypothetical protein